MVTLPSGSFALACWALLALGCSESEDRTIELEIEEGSCETDLLSEVSVVSVELYGSDADGNMCTLSKRCVFDVDEPEPITAVSSIADALRSQTQPIIDTEANGANFLAIIGRRRADGCWSGEAHPLCGFADLADTDADVLQITLRCDDCPDQDYSFCP